MFVVVKQLINIYFRCKMESEIKFFLTEENIGSECLSDLMNFGEIFLLLYLKGSFVLKMKVGHSLHVLLIVTAVCFFLKESKNKSAF